MNGRAHCFVERSWLVEERAGAATELCGEWPTPANRARRQIALCRVSREALVIGSGQSCGVVDVARAREREVEVVRRGAGGGAVHVAPGAQVWVDMWLPRGDPLWDDDVVTSGTWVGATWVRALALLGVRGAAVHARRSVHDEWSELICFAGVGPGEVTTDHAKVVGLAQRRGRDGARFLTMSHLRWEPNALLALLALDRERATRASREIGSACIGLGQLLEQTGRTGAGSELSLQAVEETVTNSLP